MAPDRFSVCKCDLATACSTPFYCIIRFYQQMSQWGKKEKKTKRYLRLQFHVTPRVIANKKDTLNKYFAMLSNIWKGSGKYWKQHWTKLDGVESSFNQQMSSSFLFVDQFDMITMTKWQISKWKKYILPYAIYTGSILN